MPAVISRQLAQTPQGVAVGPSMQLRQRARMRATVVFPGSALAGKDITMSDALLRNGVLERGADMLLADQLRKGLRPVFPGDNLVHEGRWPGVYARPRVIRGTRAKPLPLLPSGPGGVHSRPLHEARSLTNSMLTRALPCAFPLKIIRIAAG